MKFAFACDSELSVASANRHRDEASGDICGKIVRCFKGLSFAAKTLCRVTDAISEN